MNENKRGYHDHQAYAMLKRRAIHAEAGASIQE